MKLNFAIMESTELPEFLHRGSMDDGAREPTALRAISDDESLTAEPSNKDISLKKNAFEQKRGINVIVHADENNSDSDMSASNLSPHSEVVNGVSELSKDEISEEETKDTHFNMEPRNGVNKDEDSIDEFGDVGTEFSSQDFVPKTLGLKDEFSESEDGGGGDSSSYTALKSTVSDGTTGICLNEDSSNPKTNVIQEIGEENEPENMEEKCSGEASKSEFDNDDDDDGVDVDENSDWQGRSTSEKTSKLSIVEDYLSDENSSDKEVSKDFSDNESGGDKLADRQFKEISSETSSEGETAKGDARTDAKFKDIEKDISSEDDEAMLKGKQLKEISEDNSSEDETVVGDSLGDGFYGTEKYNASSEHHKDDISEDESIKSNIEEGVREDSLERKTVAYDDMQRSSAEECEKTDPSDDESDGDSSAYYSPLEEDSRNFDEHLKHSGDDRISSDSESFDKDSVGDDEEKSSHSHDFKHKQQECSLSSDSHKYKDVRENKDETFSEYSFDDKVMNSSSDDVKSHKYLSRDESCEVNDVDTEINKDECEITELKDIQTSVAAENGSLDLASTDNTREEIKADEGSTFQTDTEKTVCSSNVENEGNVNDVDIPHYNKDVKCEISEDESSEAAPNISQEPKTELHSESVLEPEDKEEAVTLNEERNLEIENTENLLKETICDNSFIRKPESVNNTCQVSCEEKPLQQEETAIKLGDVSCPSKDNSSDHEDLKHEDTTNNSDSEENNSLGKDTDGNGGTLSSVFNVSNDDRNTNSPCQILQDQEQKDLSRESVNMSTVSQDNQSDDESSSHVPVETIKNITQKADDGGPFSSGDESMENNESDNSVRDFVSHDEGSTDLNEGEHERKTEGDVETNDSLPKPQKQTKRDAIQEHPEECETSQSLLCVESKESDTGSRETTTEEADCEGTINAAQSDLQMESLGTESSRTISHEDNTAVALCCEQRDKERVCVEDNVGVVSDGHQILPSELKDKADVGEIDSANSAANISSETGESEADSSKRTSLESDNPENDSADSTGHVSCERDRSESDKSNRSDDPENVPDVVPANSNERSLEHFDSDTLDHLDNDVRVNDRKFSSDDTESKQEEEKGEGEEEGEEEEGAERGGGEKEEEGEQEEVEAEASPAAPPPSPPLKEEEEKETREGTKVVTTHEESDSASNSPSRNSVQELVQKSSSPDTSEDNSPSAERIPCKEIPKDSAHEASEFEVELNEKERTNVNENIIGQISEDTNSYSATEGSGNVDIQKNCSKDEEMDQIGENSSVNIGNGIETSPENVASDNSTGAPAVSDDVGIQSENSETSTKTELPLTNGTDYQQKLQDDAMETDDLKDRLTEEGKSDQGNTVNDVQTVKRVSMMGNLTANECVSNGDQGNNDSRKRKLSSSPEDEPISKEGCSPQFKGFKKRILAQASLEVADEQMHHQHQTLPKPEELQPDLADSYTAPLTEYAQYLGLQPIVKFKCYLCGETGFPSILYLQEHQSSCLKTSKTRPVSQQPAVEDMGETEGAEATEGDCSAVGVATATPPAPTDISGTPSTNFRITRKVYLCSVCGTYYENWNLFLHMKEMHRRFICLFCLTMFTDAGMLATHLSDEHSVTDRLYDTQECFREEIADEACFLVCCACERIFAHTDNFYEHECPTAPSVKKHLLHQQTQQEPKQLQKHRRQQQKQKQVEKSNQHIQGVCSLCGLRGAHFPTCRRASSNSNALTTLVDGSGAVTELSPPDGEQQSEKQPVSKTDTIKKRTVKGKATTKNVPSGDMDAEVDRDEDYDISHAASFCQINIHETPADKPKASDQPSSSTPVPKVTIKTKNIPTTVLSDNSTTKKNFVTVGKQEPDSPEIHTELDQTSSASLESQKPKQTTESSTGAGIKSGKRGASCSPVPTTEGKKPKLDQLNDHVKTPVEDAEERRGQTSSPVPESDSSSSHSQDSDRLHINTQESESVDGQSCADEDDAAVKDAVKDSEATDADKTEETTTPEKQVSPASANAQHPLHRMSESESESSESANDIPSHKTEDSSSSSEAEGEAEAEAVSSNEDRKQDAPPEAAVKQKSEGMSDDGGGTAEEPESGGEESSKDSPALVVDEEAADDKKENESGSSQPTTIAEGGEIQVAGDDVPALELTLEEQPEVMTLQALVKECVRVSCNSCVFCNHAKKIAVNGSQLALHLLAEHRFEPVVCTDTADLKPVPADGFTARLKEAVHNLREAFFNTDSYDSTAEPSEAAVAEQGDGSHIYDRSYECFHCHFVTSLHKELYVHNRKMHQKTILLCVMCKSNFYSYSELLCHICPGLYAPDADISFRCCLCTVDKLPSAFRLMVHLRKRHHACDVCLEATGDQQRLSNHVWKHKLHHLCYRCGIAYRNKPDITKHLFWKHGTESVLCKKCLQKKWPHVYHFCIPPTAFNCEECGTSFARAVALKVHRRLHSGDRPYTCEHCPDSFISRKLLARHRRLKHAPPEPLPPVPSSPEKNATAHRDREYPAASETEASSVKDSETDQNKSSLENKISVSLDKRTDNQMSGDGEKQTDSAVKKNKVMDVYDLPPLNLSSDSDDSDEPDTKDSKTATSPAAASAPEVKDSETEVKPDPPVSDSVVGEEEEPAPVQIIDGIWDNFKNYKASLERKEQEAAAVATGSYSTSHAIEVIMSDHDYCLVSRPSNIGTEDDVGSGDGASLHTAGGLISAEGPDVNNKTVEGDKDSGSNTDSSPETMEATDSGSRSKVAAADSVSAVSAITGGLRVSAGPEKTSDTGRAPVVATETAPSAPSGTPPQPSNLSTTTSSKKRTKQARKRQKREGASSSSSSSSSDSDSSSCSCGTNCSCSSSSSSSSGSSSSSSDSDSSTSEGRRRQAARRERRRERARKKAAAAAATAADTVPANSGDAAAEPTSKTPTANSAPVAPCDAERERPDGVIQESDLETDETETDEDFYDQYPQRQANRLLAEKRNRLMLLAAVAPASNGTAQLAQQLQELNQQHQEQQQQQRQEEPQQQQQDDQPQTQPVPLQQTLQQVQPQQHVRIRSGTGSGDSRKVRTRKRKRGVPSGARTGSAHLAGSGEAAVRPLGSLPSTTYRDSSGVVTHTPIPESASVPSATSAVRTTGGSGSEGESKRLSKRRRVPKRFYGDSSDEDGDAPVTPQTKWRKTGSGVGGSGGGAAATATVASIGAPATPSHVPEPPHLPIRQQVTLPSAAALLSSARSVAAGRRPVETVGHSTSSSSSSSSGSDDADSNYESASDGGVGGSHSGGRVGSSGGVGVGSVTGARTGGSAGAVVDNSGNKSENLYCYCQCPYDEVSEMIACDGKDCQIEWFHFECVGIMVPPKGKWFCPDCRKKSSASRGGEYLLHA